MRIKLLFALLCLSSISLSVFTQTKSVKREPFEWERIIPLITKKAEIENYYGKAFMENGYISIYDSGFGRIQVAYYGAVDQKKTKYKCNVTPDTVNSYHIALKNRIPIANLGWNLNKFEKGSRDDGMIFYSWEERGLSFEVERFDDGHEVVRSISYEPSLSEIENKCEKKQTN